MVHVCYGVYFRMERTVKRNSGDEFCLGGWEAVVIETETTDGNDGLT